MDIFYVVNINNSIIWMCTDCVDLKKDFDPEGLHKASCGPYNPSESRL